MGSEPATSRRNKPLWVIVTTGDPDGIGLEVSLKALVAIKPLPHVQFVLFRAKDSKSPLLKPGRLGTFRRVTVDSPRAARARPHDPSTLLEIVSSASAAAWVEDAAKACADGSYDALVTAPLSKTSIIAAGFKDIGHTEILARVTGRKDLFMGFVGRKFNVILATGHAPLKDAVRAFNKKSLARAIAGARALRGILGNAQRAKPIALVGVNPHAGEAGLLGGEEKWMAEFTGADVVGPLVPDAAFLRSEWPRYAVYVCPYHDQGLIPFKMIHGFTGGVHLTLGLPFVRTSVDHGTAKDLFGQNRAESGSIKDALLTAVRLARLEKRP